MAALQIGNNDDDNGDNNDDDNDNDNNDNPRWQPYRLESIDLSHNMMPVLTEGVSMMMMMTNMILMMMIAMLIEICLDKKTNS